MKYRRAVAVGGTVSPMIGTILILALTLFAGARLRGLAPARRAALAFLIGTGLPVLLVCLAARLGMQPGAAGILAVFAASAALVRVVTRSRAAAQNDGRWLGALGAAFAVSSLSAFLGRPPAAGMLVDPWAHIAWSRNLPAVFDLYPPGFPAFVAILGVDDPLVGAFRLAPFVLHAALAAQFLALAETIGAAWPGAVAALLYLVVPVAFTKFDPPRPELFAAVWIASAWWIVQGGLPSKKWTWAALALSTCVLLASHVSPLEIAHAATLGFCVLAGIAGGYAGSRAGLFLSLAAGAALSLALSPWPLTVLSRDESILLLPSAYAAAPPGAIDIARMWGPGLGAAGAASAAWFLSRFKTIPREARGLLAGIALTGILVLAPALLYTMGIFVPIPLATYRFYLAAALPLAMGAAVAGSAAWKDGRAARFGAAACAFIAALDLCLRPSLSISHGLAALVISAAAWWFARPGRRVFSLGLAAALAAALAAGSRIAIWRPSAPAEAAWLAEKGDPGLPVVAGWPEIVAIDALAPQRAIDGLPGRDGNVARHRSAAISPLHDELDWCGDSAAASVDRLRSFLGASDRLPAYIVVGDALAESWSLYAGQRAHLETRGDIAERAFWSPLPCPEEPAQRIGKIRSALESDPLVRREFSAPGVVIYRME
jgi:hypothetical protein